MTPETKGRPEPVKWILRGSLRFRPGGFEHEVDAQSAARYWRGAGHPDVEARPLYDYDVPWLLERQEKLVEALEKIAVMANVHPDHCSDPEAMKVFEGIRDEALAAAREES